MKLKVLHIALSLLLSAPLLQAQGQVSTRSHRLADFPDKVTKVVLTENSILSAVLREEVVNGWTASAFEFCTLEQFQAVKTQDFYFLIVLEKQFKGEDTPGVSFLTLLKGGPEAEKGLGKMYEVVALPLAGSEGGDGRELTYLGALVSTIQEYTLAAMESERVAYGAESWLKGRFRKLGKGKQVLLDAAEADQAYLGFTPDTLCGYVVAPLNSRKGSYCYKMLFDAATHRLAYYSKHRIDARHGAGFLPKEVKRLTQE